MNNAIVQALYKTFVRRGFATLRFNFRGVGQEPGHFRQRHRRTVGRGLGARLGAADPSEAESTWIGGFSFGAWIGMQL
jgi:alpha/beta superfamily hydrolase